VGVENRSSLELSDGVRETSALEHQDSLALSVCVHFHFKSQNISTKRFDTSLSPPPPPSTSEGMRTSKSSKTKIDGVRLAASRHALSSDVVMSFGDLPNKPRQSIQTT
jgi:hypothetical protein